MQTTWKALTKEEYQQSLPNWVRINEKGIKDIEGFVFFHPSEAYDEEDEMIVLVLFHLEKPIAALSLAIVQTNVYEINYLEIHNSFRGQELPKKMYEILNKWVFEDTVIIGSDMTLEGRKANLHEKRNRFLIRCKIFNNRGEYLKTLD